jgi:hypothetical protein
MGQNTSEVSVANQALGWLGLDSIISLDDNTKSAALCKLNLPPLRDVILEGSDWSFAQKRWECVAIVDAPVWGYSYQLMLPPDCLRICYVTAHPDEYESMPLEPWVREGNLILCNTDRAYIRYTGREEDPKKWTEGFAQALASRLASDIAIPATNSQQHMQLMYKLYQDKLREAVANDGRQAGRRQRIISNDLKQVR